MAIKEFDLSHDFFNIIEPKEGTRKIPVYAENGKGLVTLKVVPENSLSLTVENAEVTEIILKQK